MKIIYEDGETRPEKEPRAAAPAPQEPGAQPTALPILTSEQITALLQILANQQQPQPAAPPAVRPEAPKEAPVQEQHDPGTRILYQSADFEPLEKGKRKRANIPDPGTRIAIQAKDAQEALEQRNRRQKAQQGSFSVNEFSLTEAAPAAPQTVGDIAVQEVDEATEAFQTRHARRVAPAAPASETPQAQTADAQKPEPQPQEAPAPQPPCRRCSSARRRHKAAGPSAARPWHKAWRLRW
ncbi:hypothetical protein [Methanobrevibacter gottschalkii]|uniref:hypothetical protein n=1 Tax=Methanobrevibacter gottschalkii TaxID=190974 RepID=UPI0038CFB897